MKNHDDAFYKYTMGNYYYSKWACLKIVFGKAIVVSFGDTKLAAGKRMKREDRTK